MHTDKDAIPTKDKMPNCPLLEGSTVKTQSIVLLISVGKFMEMVKVNRHGI